MRKIGLLMAILCQLHMTRVIAQSATDAPHYKDTLRISGANLEHLSQYVTYWIDTTDSSDPDVSLRAYASGHFSHWPLYTNLNNGINPHPLWLRLVLCNDGDIFRRYWWSMYSHADSIILFEPDTSGHTLVAVDTTSFNLPLDQRKVKARFPAMELQMNPQQCKTLYMRVRSLHKAQNAFMDITTPDHNLLWEKRFYWTIGFFVGAFILVFLISILLGTIARQSIFFVYATYIIITILIILQEELLITRYPDVEWFQLLYRFHSLPLTIVGLALHFFVLRYVFNVDEARPTLTRVLSSINWAGLVYGAGTLLAFFLFYQTFDTTHWAFRPTWYLSLSVIMLLLLVQLIMIISSGRTWMGLAWRAVAGGVLVYMNHAGFYLNYEGLVSYYEITYPNYFYWTLLTEFIAFALLLAWRYRRTLTRNLLLEQEKVVMQQSLIENEINTQERERRRIAFELHDNLGTSLITLKQKTQAIKNEEFEKVVPELMRDFTQLSDDLRRLSHELLPMTIEDIGLEAAVKELALRYRQPVIHFEVLSPMPPLERQMSLQLYRIIQELMKNSIIHGQASNIIIQFLVENSRFQLTFEDDGVGFDTASLVKGLGLKSIETRIHFLKGMLTIESQTGNGTLAIIDVPV